MATTPNASTPVPPQPQSNNSLRVVIIILILLALFGGIALWLFSNQSSSTDQTSTIATATPLETATPLATAVPSPTPTPVTKKDDSNAAVDAALNKVTDVSDQDLTTTQKSIQTLK